MYLDHWRIHAAAAVGVLCATPLALDNVHDRQLVAALGWGLAALGCVAILLGPLVSMGQAEKRNPPHGRHSSGKTKY